MTTRPDISPEGQFLAHRFFYEIAASTGETEARRRALAGMVDTGMMNASDEPAALRTLAAMALKAGDAEEAIARYREVIGSDRGDYQSRINLGVLLQKAEDSGGAKVQFLGAIAIMQREGLAIPQNLLQASR